jgi:hypothetical protein
MALIICPKCGKEFSEYAHNCPSCNTSIFQIKKIDEYFSWTKRDTLRSILVFIIFILAHFIVFDQQLTTTGWGVLFLDAILVFGVAWILTKEYLIALLFTPLAILLFLFKFASPHVNEIKSADSYDNKRCAYYCIYRYNNGDLQFLTPTKTYVFNKTGKTLYLTSVTYGNYRGEYDKYKSISNKELKDVGPIYYYFEEPPTVITTKGSGGECRQVIDFIKH